MTMTKLTIAFVFFTVKPNPPTHTPPARPCRKNDNNGKGPPTDIPNGNGNGPPPRKIQ